MYAIRRGKAAKGAWYWVVAFSRDSERHCRRFYDLRHGGNDAAHAAAVAWRDAELAKAQALSFAEFCAKPRSNNSSGATGVVFATPARSPDGVWQARLKLGGKPAQVKSFSVRKYGDAQAYDLAVKARAAMLEAAADNPYVHHPVAKQFAADAKQRKRRARRRRNDRRGLWP